MGFQACLCMHSCLFRASRTPAWTTGLAEVLFALSTAGSTHVLRSAACAAAAAGGCGATLGGVLDMGAVFAPWGSTALTPLSSGTTLGIYHLVGHGFHAL